MIRPSVSMIVAMAENNVIGRDGDMPWKLSSDLKRFRALTMGKPVLMGRKTFQSIGRALDGRLNIIVTGNPDFSHDDVVIVRTPEEGLEAALRSGADEVMVIGGGSIYARLMPHADRLYVTHVAAEPEGDTHFPHIDLTMWQRISHEPIPRGERDSAATAFVIYERI
ncbi:dihydrofolate reductase [Hartmannibacter diazotrophicus]|uniref:dihydrofolate reductase n=1 Tax=Hartmannibacter diazotrophicus TaxID=1482074 RepID=UPI001570444E|nr:dihydrofolate reductase [Hartmannibacter diazotrophicus]